MDRNVKVGGVDDSGLKGNERTTRGANRGGVVFGKITLQRYAGAGGGGVLGRKARKKKKRGWGTLFAPKPGIGKRQ